MSRVLKKSSGIDCPARTIHEEDLQAAAMRKDAKERIDDLSVFLDGQT